MKNYRDIFSNISTNDVHNFITKLMNTVSEFKISSSDTKYLGRIIETFKPNNIDNDTRKGLCIFLEEISIFDENDNKDVNYDSLLSKYLKNIPLKKEKLINYIPIILITNKHEASYASIDNLKDNINRIYNNFPEFTDFLKKSTGLDTIPYDFFIRVNGIPAGVERSSEYLRFFSELLNDKEQKYYSEFHEFLDVLSYGTINY